MCRYFVLVISLKNQSPPEAMHITVKTETLRRW